ncbi:MAG: hypothetical protein ACXVLX_08720 [Ilumatobacteraceae bacterium]
MSRNGPGRPLSRHGRKREVEPPMAKQQYPIIERHSEGVTVTARNSVEAQQAANDALGTDCTITSVEKVHEGGIGGFFATELVRMTAKPSQLQEMDAVLTSAEDLVSSLRARAPHFADRLLEEWCQEQKVVEPAKVWQAAPQRVPAEPAPRPVAAPAAVDPVPRPAEMLPNVTVLQPAPVAMPARATVDQRWSHHVLRAMGIPDRVVDAALTHRPTTESEWIVALMGALSGLCTGGPIAPTVMVGPSCANLARQLKLISVAPDELVDSVSSVAVPHVTARALAASLNGRLVHLVVGGGWQHLGGLPVHVVSAASAADLLEAMRVCVAWDASLGWYWSGERYDRIDEFTIVSHIRAKLCVADPVFVPA